MIAFQSICGKTGVYFAEDKVQGSTTINEILLKNIYLLSMNNKHPINMMFGLSFYVW